MYMFQASNLSCYDKSQQAQGKLPVCQYWHEEDTIEDMIEIDYYNQNYLLSLMNGIDFLLRLYSKSENKETSVRFTFDKVRKLYQLTQLVGGSDGDANVVHDSTLTGAGTSASPLGLSESVKDEIAGKQDKLTAGENITIEDGVISATGGGAGGDYLPLSGGTLTGDLTFEWSGQYMATRQVVLKSKYYRTDTETFVYSDVLTLLPNGEITVAGAINSGALLPKATNIYQIGSPYLKWNSLYVNKINNGADIAVPTTGGTMVVATPPTEDGTYVLKCVVVDGVPTVSWVKE